MSQLTEFERSLLDHVAFELHECWGERGHNVDAALERDPAFGRDSTLRLRLARALFSAVLCQAASRIGLWAEPGPHGQVDLYMAKGTGRRVFRMLSAKRSGDGQFAIPVNASSSLGRVDEGVFEPDEHWVFGFVLGDDGPEQLFVAPVEGISAGMPGSIRLGEVVLLGGMPGPFGSFVGDEEDELGGFVGGEDEDGLELSL